MNEHADPIAQDLDALRTALGDWFDALAQLPDDQAADVLAEVAVRIENITL